jgi:heme exporter protein A
VNATILARGLEKRFGGVVALRGVDLSLEKGQALAILGPNGAGKSTLLKILAGLCQPTSGCVEFEGQTFTASDAHGLRSKVGFAGHATMLYPEMTAMENLLFAGRLHGVADAHPRACALLAEAGLESVAERRAGGFSRGMSQRLAVARSLMHDPAVLLLDEPFSGLDRRSVEALVLRLKALREGGRTLVFVTHEVRWASDVASAALVLAAGRVASLDAGPALDVNVLEVACNAAAEASE